MKNEKDRFRFDDAYGNVYRYENGAYLFFATYHQCEIEPGDSERRKTLKAERLLEEIEFSDYYA